MASTKQVAAAKRNVEHAQKAASEKRTIANLPAETRRDLGRQAARARQRGGQAGLTMGSLERGPERPPDPKPDEPNPPPPPHPDPPMPTAGARSSRAPGAAAMVFPATAALLLRPPAERAALTGRAARLRG